MAQSGHGDGTPRCPLSGVKRTSASANTGKHLGPQGEGHKGDMPVLAVDTSGKATKAVTAPHLTVADVKSRSIMVHAGGDNYSDQPAPLVARVLPVA